MSAVTEYKMVGLLREYRTLRGRHYWRFQVCPFKRRIFSIASSQLDSALPYVMSFSGSVSDFMAKLTSWIFPKSVCSELSKMLPTSRRDSSSAVLMITTGLLHLGQKTSFPLLKSGVPHSGHVSWSMVAPDLRSSAILLTSILNFPDHGRISGNGIYVCCLA